MLLNVRLHEKFLHKKRLCCVCVCRLRHHDYLPMKSRFCVRDIIRRLRLRLRCLHGNSLSMTSRFSFRMRLLLPGESVPRKSLVCVRLLQLHGESRPVKTLACCLLRLLLLHGESFPRKRVFGCCRIRILHGESLPNKDSSVFLICFFTATVFL